MPIRVTNKAVKVHTDYFEFAPRWSLEKGEYAKARITPIDEKKESRFAINKDRKQVLRRSGDLGEPESTWPYEPTTDEKVWFEFLDKIVDKNNKFYPARDEDRRPIKEGLGKGACHVITDIIRLKTADNTEFLLSKGFVIGHDAAGEELDHPVPWPERWFKTLFKWESPYNDKSKQFQKTCVGPIGFEIQFAKEFSKQNAKELFDQRANDFVNFVVKDEVSDKAKRVEPDVNAQKTFERFSNNSFEFLWTGQYIPLPVRQELRQEAVARGDIRGGAGDYQVQAQPTKAGKTTYQ